MSCKKNVRVIPTIPTSQPLSSPLNKLKDGWDFEASIAWMMQPSGKGVLPIFERIKELAH